MISNIEDLIEYLRVFHRLWLDDPRLDPAAISDDLPHGLARLYHELGSLVELDPEQYESRIPFATQDGLVEVGRLKRVDNMVEFAWENQGNWSCRFPLGEDDPPVYSDALDVWQEPARGFQKICDSLNHFLVTLCLQEAVFSCPNLITSDASSVPEALNVVPAPIWLGGHYVDA